MEVMDEWQIAMWKAKFLHRLRYGGQYCSTCEGSSYDHRSTIDEFDEEELDCARLERMATQLAMLRAKATRRDLKTVLMEVELQIAVNLATLLELAPAIHDYPVVSGTRAFRIGEDRDGEVCGVCQEELEKGQEARAMDCMHMFHDLCIWKWLEIKSSCPLCRNPLRSKQTDES